MGDFYKESFGVLSEADQIDLPQKYSMRDEREKEIQDQIIASLHYKINLLSNGFHTWKLFMLQSRVQKRLQDVARIHYEETLLVNFFAKWKSYHQNTKICRLKERHDTLKRVFYYWKNTTQLQRVKCQRSLQSAKEHHNNFLLGQMFRKWKEAHDQLKADNFWKEHRKTQILRIWKLQHYKRILQRRLARYHNRNIILRKTFCLWKDLYEEKHDKRCAAVTKLNRIWLQEYFDRMKLFTKQQEKQRDKMLRFENNRQLKMLHKSMLLWKYQIKIEIFTRKHVIWQSRNLERKFYVKWRAIILTRQFEEKKNLLVLKGYFKQWISQKSEEETNRDREKNLRRSLDKKMIHLHFHHWRLDTQYELLIQPMVLSAQHKLMRRIFIGWNSFTKFRGKATSFRKSIDFLKKKDAFSQWRRIHEKIMDQNEILRQKENIILEKCVMKWQDLMSFKKVYMEKKVEILARHWLDVTQQARMKREIEMADLANIQLIERVYFTKWLHRANKVSFQRRENENEADRFLKKHSLSQALNTWRRQYEVQRIVSDYLDNQRMEMVNKIFSAWLQITRIEVENQIEAFNQRCDFANSTTCSLTNDLASVRRYPTTKFPKSSTPCLQRSHNTDQSLFSMSTLKVYENMNENFERRRKSDDSVGTNDRSFFNGFTYDSDYEISEMLSPEEKSSHHSYNTSPDRLESTSHTLSPNKSDPIRPLSWTDVWKKRYLGSKSVAMMRRKSFEHDHESIASQSLSLPRDFGNTSVSSLHFTNRSVGSAVLLQPRPHEILNRTLPFVRCPSYEELLTSGVYSYDEDVASVASTLQSRAKENLLVGTIKHWRHYDVSSVFYAWLKYSARKKFHREVLQSHTGKKDAYLLHMMFLKWNRQLYSLQAANDCYRKQKIRRCLNVWREFALLRRRKERMGKMAEEFRRNRLLFRFVKTLKNKYNKKTRLNKVANVWIEATSKNTAQEELIEKHQDRWNQEKMKLCFERWKEEKMKTFKACQHYNDNLINRVLNVWWCLVLVKENQKKKIKSFQLKHNGLKALVIWKRRLSLMHQVDLIRQVKEMQLIKTIFQCWLHSTKVSRDRMDNMQFFIDSRNYSLKNDAFKEWFVVWNQNMSAKRMWSINLSRKIFDSWYLVIIDRKERNLKLKDFSCKQDQVKLRKIFLWWKGYSHSNINYRLKVSNEQSNLLREIFIHWRKAFLKRKSSEFHEHHTMIKYFHLWKDAYVLKVKEASLMRSSSKKWVAHCQAAKENEETLELIIQTKDFDVLQTNFLSWRKQAIMSIDAKNHFVKVTVKKSLQIWREYSNSRRTRNDKYLSLQKKHRETLVSAAFEIWKDASRKATSLKIVKTNLLQCRVRRMALDWRLNVKANKFEYNRTEKLIGNAFRIWKQNLDDQLKYRQFQRFQIKKRKFLSWKASIEHKNFLENLADKLLLKRQNTMWRAYFSKWIEEFDQIQKRRRKEQENLTIAKDHYNKSLLSRHFHQWKISFIVTKAIKKRRNRLCDKYAKKWLHIVQMKHLAEQIYKQNLLNRIWMRWRCEYSKKKVIENFMKQDQRKATSEVFLAWSNHTKLRITLPKALTVEKKKMWFRKWMSVYNNS